ncbi:hypothetical protein Q6348_10435 [Isoptericola sp. b441]|uniref:Uncharacterized protein n=1 Tax=Actinotalea lenta TaxID=3064654 RepID=A0ABT9D9N1_9CELL|nr:MULTISPECIES: hypothetical protein [unclassified Isoptericola]MDO8107612.1 hypothetical protein [Isoptericola sp. b441]MDO8120728.1 hypothetical protein [Isoptericola sp. b490]
MTVAALVVVALIGVIFVGLGVWTITQIFPAPRSGSLTRGHHGGRRPARTGIDRRGEAKE